jgi:glycosyltransferase involved in cell wall biosynthesis
MRHRRPQSVLQVVGSIREYGAENFVPLLSRELDRLGVPVAILTVRGPAAECAGPVPVLSARRRSRWDIGFFFRMVKIIREYQPTVVHTHGYHGKLWGRLAARLAGIRTIVHTEHNSDFSSRACQRVVNCVLNRSTDAVVTFSDVLAARLVKEDCVPMDRIVVIPNGVAPPERKPGKFSLRAQPPIEKGVKVILHVGRLMKVKNQQLAIRVCRELLDLHPNQRFCVLFAGSGKDEHALKELAATLGVSDRVRFLGYRNDVDQIMRRCNVVLLTSLNEAMPLTVLEAMYAGTPIVTTPWHGARELLEDGKLGCVTASYDPKTVAIALSQWLDDRDGTMRAADAAYSAVRSRFDIRITARQHAALYARFNLAN